MVSSLKFVCILLISLVSVSVCSASRSKFNSTNDDKKNNAQTQVTTSAVGTSNGGYSCGNNGGGGSSCCNGGGGSCSTGGGGSMSGCDSSCSNGGGGGCMSGDCHPPPCQTPTAPCQMPMHCTPQCPQPQPQPTPCNSCNRQPSCTNNDCGNGGYGGVGSIGTDSEDPYSEMLDNEPNMKKPDSDGTN